jgi:hypothetical protein
MRIHITNPVADLRPTITSSVCSLTLFQKHFAPILLRGLRTLADFPPYSCRAAGLSL